MCGPRASVPEYTAEAGHIRIHGIPEREVGANDFRQTSRTGKQIRAGFLGSWVLRVHDWERR